MSFKATGMFEYHAHLQYNLVPNNNSIWRVCGDFMRLNTITLNCCPLLWIGDFTSLQGSTIFSKLNLVQAYHQILIVDEDIHKTVVTILFKLYKFTRKPFGFRNAVQTFQRFREVFRSLTFIYAFVDYILIASLSIWNIYTQNLPDHSMRTKNTPRGMYFMC